MGGVNSLAKHYGVYPKRAHVFFRDIRKYLDSSISDSQVVHYLITHSIGHLPKPNRELAFKIEEYYANIPKEPRPQINPRVITNVNIDDAVSNKTRKLELIDRNYFDRERVAHDKLEHCPHGIPVGEICGICDPKAFREMTGID
jgi:hypothetical protein